MGVTVYTSPTCTYCHQVKRFLSQRGVDYTERDVSTDRSAADEMINISHQMGVPVTVIEGQVVVGFDRERLEQLLTMQSHQIHFGIKVADASKIADKSNITPVPGAYVGAIKTSSLAERAGLHTGDIITHLNSGDISGANDLKKELAQLKKGSLLKITYIRGDHRKQTEVII